MEDTRRTLIAHARRLRSSLLVFTAIVLFLAGLLLLFAPRSSVPNAADFFSSQGSRVDNGCAIHEPNLLPAADREIDLRRSGAKA